MLSKRNYKERLRKMEQKTERFSIRKLSVGAASVLIGLSFLGFNAHTAHAATNDVKANNDVKATTDANVDPVDSQSNLDIKNASDVASSAASSAAQSATEKASSASSSAVSSAAPASSVATNAADESEAATTTFNVKDLAKDANSNDKASAAASVLKESKVAATNADATTDTTSAYKNSQDVEDWASFINALSDANVDNINLTKDITVTGAVGKQADITQSILYPGRIYLESENIARKVTVSGNNHTIDFGKYSLGLRDANQKNGSGWDLTFKDLTINAGNLEGSSLQTDYTSQSPINLYTVSADNQAKDTVTFENVTADVKDRPVINGHYMNRSGASYIGSEKYTLILKGNNNLKSTSWTGGVTPGDDGDAISAGYIIVEDGTTTVDMPQTSSYNLQYGGAAVRVAQADTTDGNGNVTKYSLDVKNGATLNVKGGKDVKGIVIANATTGTVNIDGNVNMDMGEGHSIAMLAGNLTVGKTGNLDITTKQLQNTGQSIANFNSGQYGVLSIGVGYPANLTNQDSNTITDNGSIKIVRTSTGETYGPLISMGSGSSGLLKGNFTVNVNQGATLDLQDNATQTGLGMIYVSGSSVKSFLNIVNPKYVNLQRLNTPLPKTGSNLIYLEGQPNGINITNSPIAEWQAANMSTAPNFTWMVQSVNSMNNWGTNASSGLTVAGKTSPENKKGETKFLDSNGKVIMAPSQSGTNSFEYNGSQKVNQNSNQGIIVQGSGTQNYYTPYLNQFLNNYNYWDSQRLAMGSSLLNPDSPVVSKDNDLYEPEVQTINGTTKQTLNDLDPNKGIKDLQKATLEDGKWTSTTVPVDGIVKSVAWYTSADASDWADIMAGQDTPTNPEGNLKTTDTSAWAKVTYEDGSIDFVNIPLNITDKTDADLYTPSYKDTNVTKGSTTTIPVTITDENGKTTTAPEGTQFKVGDFTAPEGTTVTVDPTSGAIKVTTTDKTPTGEFDIPVTVTYPDGSVDNATAKVTVTANPTDADKYTPEGQDVHTGVGETPSADQGIANKGDLPTGTKYSWKTTPDVTTPGTKDATVVVTYPDGSQDEVPVHVIVTANPTDADKYTPEGQDVHTNVGETPSADQGIANKGDLPTGTKYSWKTTPDVSTPGTKDATVVVTYPDNSTDEVPVHVIVDKPETHYSENATGTPIVTEKGVMPNPADGIGNKGDLDPNTKYTWTNGEPDVSKIGKTTVSITVTYPDGKTQIVDTPLIVTGTETPGDPGITNPDDPAYSDLFKTVTRTITTETPNSDGTSTSSTNVQKVVFGRSKTVDKSGNTTYSNYTIYDTTTNKLTNTTTGTFPKVAVPQHDGYISEVNGAQATEVSEVTGVTPNTANSEVTITYVKKDSDASKYTPEGQDVPTKEGVVPDASEGIKNKTDLPDGTKYSWEKTPDVTTPGSHPAVVVVTYPDGSQDKVPVNVVVPAPEGQNINTPQGVVPDPSKGIKNPQDMPDGTKYTWKDTPDVSTPGSHPAVVVVTYPDGNKTEVPVTIIVTDNTPSTPVTPSQPTDSETYTPEPKPIDTDKGVMPNPEDGIKNPGDLPSGTKYEWTNGEPDVNTPGTRPVSITVIYPDGSTDIVTTTITVNEPAPVHSGDDDNNVDTNKGGNGNGNGETAPVHAAVTNNGDNGNHASFYNNGDKNAKTLPQTGVEANMAGLLGLMIASVGAILGLAADKKRKN